MEDTHSARVEKLWWIAVSHPRDIREFLADFDREELPEIITKHLPQPFDHYDVEEVINDYKIYGFLAEVMFPQCSNFTFSKDAKNRPFPSGWSVSEGICRSKVLYAESLSKLISEIKKISDQFFQEDIERERKKTE